MKRPPKIKGINRWCGKWVARLDGKYIGRYDTQVEAVAAKEKAVAAGFRTAGVLKNMVKRRGLQSWLNTNKLQ